MSEYDWSASPSALSDNSSTEGGLGVYPNTDTSPTPLNAQGFLDGAGALGDPCAVGPGCVDSRNVLDQGRRRHEIADGK